MKIITRTVWLLSFVSLFTDVASEMLYPVTPMYLKSIGFSVLLIGLLEGIAEAVAGLSKGYFGKLSDASGKRTPFIRAGYALSAISKPMMAFFTSAWWIFFARTSDRVGKGLRTGARDAMLAGETTTGHKAKVFGFHRAMDTLGATIGPALALLYLYFYPANYRQLFLIAFLPGVVAIFLTLVLKEKPAIKKSSGSFSFFISFAYFKKSSASYKKLVGGLLFFALVNSSDVFLLMKAKDAGLPDVHVIGVYIFYNLVYALLAFPAGMIADRIGIKKMFVTGLFLFTAVYAGMSFAEGVIPVLSLFFLYGAYAAATESIAKAWISNISPAGEQATSIGTYTGFQSICTLLASVTGGALWYFFHPSVTFIVPAVAAFFLVFYFLLAVDPPHGK